AALPARQPLPVHGLSQDHRGGVERRGARVSFRVVGHRVPRVDAIEKVTGRARYVTDLVVPGMLHGRLLRSPYPHARIQRLDLSRARTLPGVFAVIGSGDLT